MFYDRIPMEFAQCLRLLINILERVYSFFHPLPEDYDESEDDSESKDPNNNKPILNEKDYDLGDDTRLLNWLCCDCDWNLTHPVYIYFFNNILIDICFIKK